MVYRRLKVRKLDHSELTVLYNTGEKERVVVNNLLCHFFYVLARQACTFVMPIKLFEFEFDRERALDSVLLNFYFVSYSELMLPTEFNGN